MEIEIASGQVMGLLCSGRLYPFRRDANRGRPWLARKKSSAQLTVSQCEGEQQHPPACFHSRLSLGREESGADRYTRALAHTGGNLTSSPASNVSRRQAQNSTVSASRSRGPVSDCERKLAGGRR